MVNIGRLVTFVRHQVKVGLTAEELAAVFLTAKAGYTNVSIITTYHTRPARRRTLAEYTGSIPISGTTRPDNPALVSSPA